MKKILVTGGAGYIGSHNVKELVKNNFEVVVFDSLEAGHKEALPKDVVLEVADLADKNRVEEVFQKHAPDAVIDFAAYLAVGESMEEPLKYFDNNVANFIKLLDVMSETGCKFIVKSSTAAVYGNPTKESDIPWRESFTEKYKPVKSALLSGKWSGESVSGENFFQKFIKHYQKVYNSRPELQLSKDEITKLRIPMSVYGLSKLLDEIILVKYNKMSGIESVALRYFNVCGADPSGETGDSKPKPTTLMALSIAQILGKIPELSVFGNDYLTKDGTGVRDYIHPSDLAIGHAKSLNYLFNGGASNTFNFATGEASTVLDVIKAVEAASGQKIKYQVKGRRSGDPSVSVADSSKAKKILGWTAKYRLPQMAKTAWDWESKNKKKILKNN